MLAARLGATGYDLVLARTRNYPYKAAAGVVNRALLKELASQCPRRLCPYVESVREHYKASFDGPAALSEIEDVNILADTDSASTERCHSVNLNHTRGALTHKVSLSLLSAHWCHASCLTCGFWQISDPRKADLAKLQQEAVQNRPKRNPSRPDPGGGPWRAFLHVRCEGRRLNQEVLAELSAAYHALSQEEYDYYVTLGQYARRQWEHGCQSFGESQRRTQRSRAAAPSDHDERRSENPSRAGDDDACAAGGNKRIPRDALACVFVEAAKTVFSSEKARKGGETCGRGRCSGGCAGALAQAYFCGD